MNISQKTFDRAILVSNPEPELDGDCEKIMKVARLSFGIGMSPCEADRVWSWWSKKHCAQWLEPDTGSVQTAIVDFVIEYVKS